MSSHRGQNFGLGLEQLASLNVTDITVTRGPGSRLQKSTRGRLYASASGRVGFVNCQRFEVVLFFVGSTSIRLRRFMTGN